jgi:hypothetical protein
MGVIKLVFHWEGIEPTINERLNNIHKGTDSEKIQDSNIILGIPSGPGHGFKSKKLMASKILLTENEIYGCTWYISA